METIPELNKVGLHPAAAEGVKDCVVWHLYVARVREVVIGGKVKKANVIVITDDASGAIVQNSIGLTPQETEAALHQAISHFGPPHRLILDHGFGVDLQKVVSYVGPWGTTVAVLSCSSPAVKGRLERVYKSQLRSVREQRPGRKTRP